MEAATKSRILIVDDDAMVRMLARAALDRPGIELDEAGNGVEAVGLFAQQGFDLVLLDLEMPVLDGFAACSRIRSLPAGETATLVVMTGLDDLDSIQRAYDLGATDFITKPLNWVLLAQRVRYLLRTRWVVAALREHQEKLSQAQQIAHLGHWEWDVQGNRAEWSMQVYELLGRTPETCAASYSTFLEAVHPQDRAMVNQAIAQTIEDNGSYSLEHRILLPDGRERILVSHGRCLREKGGATTKVHSVIQDITEARRAEERIFQLAYYDTLTGLPNRSLFIDFGQRLLAAALRDYGSAAVILLNIDRFKRINESLGHAAGDELLREVAGRIAHSVRGSDLVAKTQQSDETPYSLSRPSADEFMLLIRAPAHTGGVTYFVQRLLSDLSQPINIRQQELFVKNSIGIALYPGDGENLERLVANAGAALAHAKEAGGGCFRYYAKDMNLRASERLSMESRLNQALQQDEFQLYYQPQISLSDGRLIGFEALLRWHPRGLAPVPPSVFIPIAEESGLIVEIGTWVLDCACRQLAAWQEQGCSLVPVAVNISARQFTYQNLVKTIAQSLAAAQVAAVLLELELTERIIMRDVDDTRDKLQALKSLGVKLSVDDFGTGYSSMSYLKRFPLDTLKIDHSFVKDLESDSNDESIVRAIVALSKGLGLTTVAEGVETEGQRRILTDIGCDSMQGYLFSRPVPAREAAVFLSRRG
jgi:diguanylate cyclase (GGDEF)-like protein/PAS domain S-box-containing protein